MKRAILSVVVFLASNFALAAEPKVETYSLKNGGLKFAPTYQQCLAEIKQTDSRIQLLPEAKDGAKCSIPYAILCSEIKLSEENFKKLVSIDVSAQSKIPSAAKKSRYGGTTTIGSDRFIVTADFPNPDTASSDAYQFRSDIDAVSTDPNTKSNQRISTAFKKNDVETGGARSIRSTSEINSYHSVRVFAFLKTREDFLESASIQVPPRISVSSSSSFADREIARDDYTADRDGAGSLDMDSELLFDSAGGSSKADKAVDRKISVCWSPNNYSSVTNDPAELIDPLVELRYAE